MKEQVNCYFLNSNAEQKCYTDDGLYGCSGVGKCASGGIGEKDKKLAWKSSCGGYAYTVIDGVDGYAEFKCVPDAEVALEDINNKGFRFAYWQCYDGSGQQQGDKSSCQLSEYWQDIAIKFCENKCAGEKKCGVNSYSVTEECYTDSKPVIDDKIQEVVVAPTPPSTSTLVKEEKKQEPKEEKVGEKKEEILICKDSCPLDGKCYPFGYRNKGSYCSDTGSFVEQLKSESVCQNNFECSSNLCIDGSCVSSSLIQKVLGWLKNIFG